MTPRRATRPVHGRPRWRSLRRVTRLPAAVAVASLAAGCGGGSKAPSVASLGTAAQPGTTSSASAPLSPQREKAVDDAYAGCLDAHGAEARVVMGGGAVVIVTPSTQGRPGAAQKTCRRLLPKGGLPPPTPTQVARHLAQMRRLAECMRSNGVPRFPDPSADGSLMFGARCIDPRSPRFRAAQKACAKDFPGGPPP
jgi:hypothetical protein